MTCYEVHTLKKHCFDLIIYFYTILQVVKTSTDIVIHVHLNLSLHPAPVMRTLWQRPIPCGLCQPLVLGPPVPGAHRAWVCP